MTKISGNRSIVYGYIVLELRDPASGKPVIRTIQPMESLVRNFLVMIERMFKGEDSLFPPPSSSSVTLTDGSSYTLSLTPPTLSNTGAFPGWSVVADSGDRLIEMQMPTDWGILVGKGTSPTTINYWKLENPYPHGHGSGYMNYLSTSVEPVSFDESTVKFSIRRLIVNDAPVSQTVTEVGLVAREYNTWKKFMIARDLLSQAITMPPNSLLEVTIVISGIVAPYQVIYTKDYAVGYDEYRLSRF